jgi:hypothetical protein
MLPPLPLSRKDDDDDDDDASLSGPLEDLAPEPVPNMHDSILSSPRRRRRPLDNRSSIFKSTTASPRSNSPTTSSMNQTFALNRSQSTPSPRSHTAFVRTWSVFSNPHQKDDADEEEPLRWKESDTQTLLSPSSTFDSSVEEGSPILPKQSSDCEIGSSPRESVEPTPRREDEEDDRFDCAVTITTTTAPRKPTTWTWFEVYFICLLANVGNILRVFLGRGLGGDCENVIVADWFTPWFQTVCITSSGQSGVGGALFVDLPANMLGCFVLGLVSYPKRTPPAAMQAIQSRQEDSPREQALYNALAVGLCGCLTSCKLPLLLISLAADPSHAFVPCVFSLVVEYANGHYGRWNCQRTLASGKHGLWLSSRRSVCHVVFGGWPTCGRVLPILSRSTTTAGTGPTGPRSRPHMGFRYSLAIPGVCGCLYGRIRGGRRGLEPHVLS